MIDSKAFEYIENESFVVVNPDYPVIAKEKAIKAVYMQKHQTKEKCIAAFRAFLVTASLTNASGISIDFEKYFEQVMNKI